MDTKHLGEFIKNLREERGMTQVEMAEAMKTSQSAVARFENGEQNLTLENLNEISRILGRKIVNPTDSIDFQIEGGRELSGSIKTNPSKNGAMGLLCAALLNDGKTILHNIPQIEEVKRLLEVYESVGIKVKWLSKNTLEIDPPKIFKMENIDKGSAGKIRSALMMIGALVHKLPKFNLPHAGGCKMGNRTIAAHRYALEELGVQIKTKEEYYEISNAKQPEGFCSSSGRCHRWRCACCSRTPRSRHRPQRRPASRPAQGQWCRRHGESCTTRCAQAPRAVACPPRHRSAASPCS
jgi:UDP-N-acetylglucosamine 1-carboxyvinyltransferase